MSTIMQYTIGQVAQRTGLSIHTLRYYEKEGILPFIRRNEYGVRVYEDQDIEWMIFVCCLRETGMSISDIKEYVHLALQGNSTIEERLGMLEQQRHKIEAQIGTLNTYIDMINRKTDLYYSIQTEKGATRRLAQPAQKG